MLTVLQRHGYKATVPRKTISRWLSKRKGIFAVSEIVNALPRIDKVSVYRTVELLVQLDLIHPVFTNHGELHYEKHRVKEHHHHAVCTRCEKSVCVDCSIPARKIRGFASIHHSFIITGVCVRCATP